MASLSTELRNQLERAVKNARDIAEQGARAAIEQLAVHEYEPYRHLTPDQRELRNRLRARARQLGDTRDQTGRHGIGHLVVETAYEHWHRMLFARFLAENNVLIHPEGMPVTLEECDELAPDEGAADGWELAARYAAKMLPQIFRPDSPVFELTLPRERVQQLERLLDDLPPSIFQASDSLGWVYQFWQAKKKDEVNASEVKIGADEISAVTQLFTEPYMVDFLLQNTLGAWWVGRHGKDSLPVEMPYLRFLDDGTPAAGTYDGWPKTTAELKVLDPCCGSGHFLVAAFDILVRFRMAEEGLGAADACEAVLRDNLHGLEIDERCTQIAVFALALAGWTFEGSGGHRVLPQMHVACSGLAPRAKESEWLDLAGDNEALRNGMRQLYGMFRNAPVLGSLIDPVGVNLSGHQQELNVASFDRLQPLLNDQLSYETGVNSPEKELIITAKGILCATDILAQHFTLVMTNVPYLGIRKQSITLRQWCEANHNDARHDLATVFISRCEKLCEPLGTFAAVLPHNWLTLGSYEELRRRLLRETSMNMLARLGTGAFETISGEVVSVVLMSLSRRQPHQQQTLVGVDASSAGEVASKQQSLISQELIRLTQADLLNNPDARILLQPRSKHRPLSDYAVSLAGIQNGDGHRYQRLFWEVIAIGDRWHPQRTAARHTALYEGCHTVIDFDVENGHLNAPRAYRREKLHDSDQRGRQAWGHNGVLISRMGDLPSSLYLGELADQSAAIMFPNDPHDLLPIWCYCTSPEYAVAVRKLDHKVNVTSATLAKVPFDRDGWKRVAAERYPEGLPEPDTASLTNWFFNGSVRVAELPLQVAIARLLGYAWPEQSADHLASLVDDDGIVCLPALRGELPASTRLQTLLAQAYGDDWSPHVLTRLLEAAGCKGWTLDRWLADKFFEQHCKLFGNRPFIWHIWDGLKDGFSALVNYHKLDRPLLETLTFNYLGDWIRQQQAGGDGSEERLAAAEALQAKLKLILDGEAPHDIFVRWKSLAQQPTGWDPDLNDGVRMNIRPFMTVPDVGKKGAGILRAKPNIKWGKDRGRDPSDAPWYDLGTTEYGGKPGDRINDHHLTLAEKQTARRGGA